MMDYMNQLLFGYYPYVAGAVFLLGSLIRFDREQYSWRSGSSQMLRARQLRWGSNLFHIGILAIFAGHFVGLLTPHALYESFGLTAAAKQMLAIVAGGIAGAFALAGGTLLLHRRLFDPRIRNNSSFGDTAILAILMTQLVLGLSTIPISLQHRDGHEMVKFMSWAQGIFTFRAGSADFVADVHWVFKAHLALGLTILLVFPFTRLVHMLSAPVWYLNRRGWQLVRTRKVLPRKPQALAPTYPTQQAVRPTVAKAKTLEAAE